LGAHNSLANVRQRAGVLLGIGGIVCNQIDARLVEHVSTGNFKKIYDKGAASGPGLTYLLVRKTLGDAFIGGSFFGL
jgi:hypothetical protein